MSSVYIHLKLRDCVKYWQFATFGSTSNGGTEIFHQRFWTDVTKAEHMFVYSVAVPKQPEVRDCKDTLDANLNEY